MIVTVLLANLRSLGVHVWPDGDQLRCQAPPGVVTPALRDELRRHKAEIIDYLRSAERLSRQSHAIVPLQPHGSHAPVFAVPGHNGDVFTYRALARHLGEDQPFFGLQAPGVDGQSDPLTSVDDLAAYFAEQILSYRPDGPYLIAGYCAGGTIAFELARRLVDQGAAVNFVALFACPYSTSFRPLPQLRQRITEHASRVRKHIRALSALSRRERWRYTTDMLRRINEHPDAEHLDATDQTMAVRARVQAATMVGVRRYVPQYFDGRLGLFLPNAGWRQSSHAALQWQSVARETEDVCGPDADCSGDQILSEPHVRWAAEQFRRCRDESLRADRIDRCRCA